MNFAPSEATGDLAPPPGGWPTLGVVIVNYAGEAFIGACLESLFATGYPALKVVVVDNDSPDDSLAAIRAWASGEASFVAEDDWPLEPRPPIEKPVAMVECDHCQSGADLGPLTLIHSGANRGFAGGVNVGLRALRRADVDYFWVLNPDTVTPPATPFRLAAGARAAGRFALIGSRILLYAEPNRVITDGGRLKQSVGGVVSVNFGADAATASMPSGDEIAFISGCSMLASPEFLDQAGPMEETYFLYFEEVDWALRRGDLPLVLVEGAEVVHRDGGSIGSSSINRLGSALAVYYRHRNILPFAARWAAAWTPLVYCVSMARIAWRYPRHGAWTLFWAALRGLHGLGPPAAVKARLPAEVRKTGRPTPDPAARVW